MARFQGESQRCRTGKQLRKKKEKKKDEPDCHGKGETNGGSVIARDLFAQELGRIKVRWVVLVDDLSLGHGVWFNNNDNNNNNDEKEE